MSYREAIIKSFKMDEIYAITEELYFIASSQLYFVEEHVKYSNLRSAIDPYGGGRSEYRKFIKGFMDLFVEEYGFDYDNYPSEYDDYYDKKSLLAVHTCMCKLGVIDNPGRMIDPSEWEFEQERIKKSQEPKTDITNPFERLEQSMEAMAEAMQIIAVQNGMMINQKRLSAK